MAIEAATTRNRVDLRTDEVVAGLVNDDVASLVATSAVALASELGCRVRFVHVVRSDVDRDDGDSTVFETAMRALRGTKVQAAFEVIAGDPADVLVDRSRVARALVIGCDRPGVAEDECEPSTARLCQAAALCDVRIVRPARERVLVKE